MSAWRKSKVPAVHIYVFTLIMILSIFLISNFNYTVKRDEYEEQLDAAILMDKCLKEIAALRTELGIPFNPEIDPNYTGIMGEEFTLLTTSVGDESAKRTGTNPNFAAVLVRYFADLGLKKGDLIVVGSSGSFPSLLLATLCACKAYGLNPLVTYSFGSSMYGSTLVDMTFYDMLERLREKDLLPYEFVAVSMGGKNDQGEDNTFSWIFELLEGVEANQQEVLRGLCEKASVPFIDIPDFEENIRYRLGLFDRLAAELGEQIKCFINVGGASYNHGGTSDSLNLANGAVRMFSSLPQDPRRGLTFEYLARGIPIINLLNIKGLALSNGLPIDPVPLPAPGEGGVFYKETYPKAMLLAAIAITLAYLIYLALKNKRPLVKS